MTNKTVAPTTATHHHYNHPTTYRDIIDRDNSKYQSLVRPPESIPVSPRYTILKRVRNWPGVNRDTKSMLSYTMWLRFKVTSKGVSLAEPHACNNHKERDAKKRDPKKQHNHNQSKNKVHHHCFFLLTPISHNKRNRLRRNTASPGNSLELTCAGFSHVE